MCLPVFMLLENNLQITVFKLPHGRQSCLAKILTKGRCHFNEFIPDNESNTVGIPNASWSLPLTSE